MFLCLPVNLHDVEEFVEVTITEEVLIDQSCSSFRLVTRPLIIKVFSPLSGIGIDKLYQDIGVTLWEELLLA